MKRVGLSISTSFPHQDCLKVPEGRDTKDDLSTGACLRRGSVGCLVASAHWARRFRYRITARGSVHADHNSRCFVPPNHPSYSHNKCYRYVLCNFTPHHLLCIPLINPHIYSRHLPIIHLRHPRIIFFPPFLPQSEAPSLTAPPPTIHTFTAFA